MSYASLGDFPDDGDPEDYANYRRCDRCGRFMKRDGYYANDHDDSWTDTYKCSQKHETALAVSRDR